MKSEMFKKIVAIDFYEFSHTYENIHSIKEERIKKPSWLVGHSPFEDQNDTQGYVVHLSNPMFSARWKLYLEPHNPSHSENEYFDEVFGIGISEVCILAKDGIENNIIDKWVNEAMCAVAYSKGFIAIHEPNYRRKYLG